MLDLDKIRTHEYYKRTSQPGGKPDWPCQVCGKKVNKLVYCVHICHGGGKVVTGGRACEDEAGCLGLHAIGKDCAKKLLKNPEFAPYVIYLAGVRPTLEEVLKTVNEAAELDLKDGFDTKLIFPEAETKT